MANAGRRLDFGEFRQLKSRDMQSRSARAVGYEKCWTSEAEEEYAVSIVGQYPRSERSSKGI
jgi:hypothetical protein